MTNRRPAGWRAETGAPVLVLSALVLAFASTLTACGAADDGTLDSAAIAVGDDDDSDTTTTVSVAEPETERGTDPGGAADPDTTTDGPGDGGGVGAADGPPGLADPLPASAPELRAALLRAETAIRSDGVGDDEAAGWGRRQQRMYRHLADHPEWLDEVLAIDDPDLRLAVELNWTARVSLDALVASHGSETELPAWRVVAPRPIAELLGYYRDGEAQWGIEWSYLAAINLIETRMGRIEGISSAGAVGPMQFLPTTWAECCDGDATDPADAIPGAARYLTIRGGPEDMERAIWGYNNSDDYVAAVSAYAAVLRSDQRAYRGYHAWQIFFRTTDGLIHLPVGYEESEPVPVGVWLAENPDALVAG
ncbi:MAG: lytic transglycosylase domain-containing protein [Actinomycetota bacterium]